MKKVININNRLSNQDLTVEEAIKKLRKLAKYSTGYITRMEAKKLLNSLSKARVQELQTLKRFENAYLGGYISSEELQELITKVFLNTDSEFIEKIAIKKLKEYQY